MQTNFQDPKTEVRILAVIDREDRQHNVFYSQALPQSTPGTVKLLWECTATLQKLTKKKKAQPSSLMGTKQNLRDGGCDFGVLLTALFSQKTNDHALHGCNYIHFHDVLQSGSKATGPRSYFGLKMHLFKSG